jgi:3-oxoacyl-[acyl-carrier-protein] synthase II
VSEKIVITGLGSVNGLGLDVGEMWLRMLAGDSAIRRWRLPGVENFPVQYAAAVDDAQFARRFAALADSAWRLERRQRFGLAAAAEALSDAGLDGAMRARCGVATGSGVPERDPDDISELLDGQSVRWEALLQCPNPQPRSLANSNDQLAADIGRLHGLCGPALNISTACAGAAHAIGLGMRMIRRGETPLVLAGGADSVLNLPTMVGLHLLGAPSTSERFGERLCRPFDRDRSGFVAGEGAAMLVLESERHARQRGARIYAELAGFGSSLDAYRITAPHPQGQGAAAAMRRALQDAQHAAQDIDCVNAHGTSTPLNDPAETLAIKQVFAEDQHFRRLAVCANKSQLGHLIAAAGAPELIASVLSIRDNCIPPTLNLENPDPLCDLDYVAGASRALRVDAVLSSSFGFGGLNTALVVRRYAH